LPPQQYDQDPSLLIKSYKYKRQANDQFYINKKYRSGNHLLSKQLIPKSDMSEYEDHLVNNLENTKIDNGEHEPNTITVETQKNKTAISLLNEWAMRGDGCEGKKPFDVSYVLTGITGHAHKPIFTYMCQTHNMKGILILILSNLNKYILLFC